MSHGTTLQHRVTAELIWDPAVTSPEVGVTAKDGIVSLSGQVATYDEKLAAEAAALRVQRVADKFRAQPFVQEIEVAVPYSFRRSDVDIATSAVARLAWNVAVRPDRISVKVSKGVITLTGEVDRHFQVEAAEQELRHLSGVVAVNNLVTVRPPVDNSDVCADISDALGRSCLFDPTTLSVSSDGGTIYLEGTVRTMQERRAAVGVAWASPGTAAVENHIRVA